MKRLLATTAILAALAVPAMALDFQADSFSQPNGFQNVTVTVPLANGGNAIRAGEISLHNNASNTDLLVWCLDLQDLLTVPYDFQEHTFVAGDSRPGIPAGLTAPQLRQIASLMLRGLTLGGLDAADDDAATQLAIWSVEYAGFTSNATGALLNRMNLELTDSQAGGILDCPNCSLTVLTDAVSAPNQALGFASIPVPAPALGAGLPGLLSACVGLWAFAKRRRQRNA